MRPGSARQAYRDIVDRATTAARGVPGVTDAVVQVRRSRVPPSPDSTAVAAARESPAGADRRTRPKGVAPASLTSAQLDGASLVLPDDAPATLTEALLRAAQQGDARGTTYVLGDGSEERQSYRQLLDDAARLLPGLRDRGLRPGDSVLIHCDDNRNFVTAFWACLLGGFVPTPVAMAPGYDWENAVTRRLREAWELLDHPPVMTDADFAPRVARLRTLWNGVGPVVLAVEELRAAQPAADLYSCGPEDPAVHLLTSGSTGVPKCVRHHHRTVIARAYANAQVNSFGPQDVTLNFMPLDHVAGMTMHNLRDVIIQCDHVNARTDAFIADPLRWLTWIERYRVTNTSGPNFVISLVTALAERIAQGRWDLSSLKDITNGGEAIVSRTMHDFLRMLAPHGMAPDVMRPAWGMSEVCGGVVHSTLRSDREDVNVVTIDNRTMSGTLRQLPGPVPGHPTYTSVGFPVNGTSVRVVDQEDRVLQELRIGRLQVRGASLMAGYYKNPQATAKAMTADGWFDTGDLAFVSDGRLVMTGREKDVIIVRSANYACHEIESVVGEVGGVLPTYVAATGEHDDATGTDELLVFCVFTDEDPIQRRVVVREIGARLARQVGLQPRRVVPVPRDAFPKTSAGKVERSRLLTQYQAGLFDEALAAIGMLRREEPQDARPWLFQEAWVPAPPVAGTAPEGPWLVLGDADVADRIRTRRGIGPVVSAVPGPRFARLSDLVYQVAPASPADYAALRTAVTRDHGEISIAVHALTLGSYASPADAIARGLSLSAPSVHSLLRAFADGNTQLLVVTTGSCAAEDSDVMEPVHGTMSALVRTANAERGRTWVRQLDVRSDEPDVGGAVLTELAAADELVAAREGGRLVTRIRPVPKALGTGTANRIRHGGLYLITGGLGGIGHRFARLLLAEFGATVVLVGRSAPAGERAVRLQALAQLGPVTYRQVDVADAPALLEIVQEAERDSGRPLDGVLHLAGADISGQWEDLDAGLLVREQADEFRRMYHSKVHGTYALASVLEKRPQCLLVLFSSVNAHFGATAFGAYASASAFLPTFAAYWHRRGRPVQCQQWSLWAQPGIGRLALDAAAHRGFRPIPPDEGVRLFLEAIALPDVGVLIGLDDANEHVACEVDAAFLDHYEVTVVPGGGSTAAAELVRETVAAALRPAPVLVRVTRPADGTGQRAPFSGGTAGRQDLEVDVASIWGEVLGCPAVPPEHHFFELGGNSMIAIKLVDRLNTEFGVRITVQQLYEHPTVRDLSGEIRNLSIWTRRREEGRGSAEQAR
jgi:acyl-CoA synthetase (AMP-forming)/AMP-acid ligase II/NADP-dependent 3-hydroxy acid dehydrogenase YdfG/acyl carrier protein